MPQRPSLAVNSKTGQYFRDLCPGAQLDLSNDMTGRDMLAVGVRNVVLARGMLDKLEGPKYTETRAELRRKGERSSESKRSADDSGVSERGRGER